MNLKSNFNFYINSDTFGWDQSEKFVKIYITSLSDLNKITDKDIVSEFTPK